MIVVLDNEVMEKLGSESATVALLVDLSARSLHLYVDKDLAFEEVEDLIKGWDLVTLSRIKLEKLFVGPVVDEVLGVAIVLEVSIVSAVRDHKDAVLGVPHLQQSNFQSLHQAQWPRDRSLDSW